MKQFTILLIFNLSISLFGQDSLALRPNRNSIQFELFGYGGLYSINYERIFIKKTSYQFCGRVGTTFYPTTETTYSQIGFISELDFLIGREKTFFEIGSGLTYAYELHNYHWKAMDDFRESLFYIPRIGVRFKLNNDKVFIDFIRVGFTPVIGIPLRSDEWYETKFQPFGGIAIGHSF